MENTFSFGAMNLKPSIFGDSGAICKSWKSTLKEKGYWRATLLVNDFLMIYIIFSDFFCSGTYSEMWWRTISSLTPWLSIEAVLHILHQLATHTMHQRQNVIISIPILMLCFLLKFGISQIYYVLETIVEFVVEYFSLWFQYHKTNIFRDFSTL